MYEFVSQDKSEVAKAERLLESALGVKSNKLIKEKDLRVSVAMPPRKNLSARDVVDLLANDEVQSPPTKKPKLDYERVIMGQELSYIEIKI